MATDPPLAKIIESIAELRQQVQQWRRDGLRIALVPTMGSLHAGHLSLTELAARHADRVVVSIFVNPLQFAAGEDFDRYPRDLAHDQQALAAMPVSAIFAPSEATLYPRGRSGITQVSLPGLSAEFCGAHRAGHFEGVTTVVSLLFNLVQPDVAVFGQKDYQQLVIISQMVRDLHFPVEIVSAPTVREPSGLAMSSRNAFLSAEQKARAAVLHEQLQQTAQALRNGRRDFAVLEQQAAAKLSAAGLQPQFFAIRDRAIGAPTAQGDQFVILAAALLGTTRLIDNCLV